MNIIKKSECAYIERIVGTGNKIFVTESVFGGAKIVKIMQTIRLGKRKIERDNKKLSKVLGKYCDANTVLVGNELATVEMDLFNQLFFARKREMLDNVQDVLVCFVDEEKKGKKRKTFVLMIDSEGWNQKEIIQIIEKAKNIYEDIYIVVKNVRLNVEQLVDYFYGEYGLVLHVITEKIAKEMQMDFGLFLVERWRESFKQCYFKRGYVVAEWEEGLRRKRKNKKVSEDKNQHLTNRELYSGFVYEINRKPITYEIGVLLCNKPNLKKTVCEEKKENPISIVAIYGVE